MKIQNLLIEDMVLTDLKSEDRAGILREMVTFLKKKGKISKEKELFERLLQRENLGSTAIGDGVAIPHCKMKGTDNPVVMLAVSRKGVDFHSLDGNSSFIFFLVVSSPDNPSLNLQILASIAHLVRKSDSLLKRILESKGAEATLDVIREEEDRLDG